MRGAVSGLTGMLGTMGKTVLPFGALIAGAGGLTGAFMGLKKASNLAADFESTATAMRVLIGDASKTKLVLEQLKTLGAETPFEFPELATAARSLIGAGESADTVVDSLRRVGDIAAGAQVPIGDMAEILGKARTNGMLFNDDLQQLGNRGVPLMDTLAGVLGVQKEQLRKMAEEGRLAFPLLEESFVRLTSQGGKFYGMMLEQSKTFSGKISTLTDAWNGLLRTIGEPVNDWLKPRIDTWTANIETAGNRLSAFIQLMASAQKDGKLMEMVGLGLNIAFKEGINVLSSGIRGAVAFLGETLPGVFRAAGMALQDSGFIYVLTATFDTLIAKLRAGIMQAAAQISFSGVSQDDADREERSAGAYAYLLKKEMESVDFTVGIVSASKALKETLEKGAAAWDKATNEPLLDATVDKAKFAELSKALDLKSFEQLVTGQAPKKPTEPKKEGKVEGLDAAIAKAIETKPTKEKSSRGSDFSMDDAGSDEPAEAFDPKRTNQWRFSQMSNSALMKKDDATFLKHLNNNPDRMDPWKMGIPIKKMKKDAEDVGKIGEAAARRTRPVGRQEKKEPQIDPLMRIVVKLESIDTRLAALGLA